MSKSNKKAFRCLKRHVARVVFRALREPSVSALAAGRPGREMHGALGETRVRLLRGRDPGGAGTGRFIGFVGIGYPAFLPELARRPELGWRLARDSWGRGLATEAAVAVREDAFERLGLDELISIIHPDNATSRRVATKVGMRIEGAVHHSGPDRDVDVWQLTGPAVV
jgi:RimJ/RimL family protein N-acetyltransferase